MHIVLEMKSEQVRKTSDLQTAEATLKNSFNFFCSRFKFYA